MSTMFVLIGVGSPSSGPKYRLGTDSKLAPAECQQKSRAKRTKDFSGTRELLVRETLGAMRHCYPSLL
jgi:hypothetical protein